MLQSGGAIDDESVCARTAELRLRPTILPPTRHFQFTAGLLYPIINLQPHSFLPYLLLVVNSTDLLIEPPFAR